MHAGATSFVVFETYASKAPDPINELGANVINVVLVDDNASFRMAAEQFVTEVCGVNVIGQADSGEAGVEMALRLRPDLMVMDLAMGGINGIEAGRRIKAADDRIKVIILTLNDGKEYRELAESLALDGFICKADFTTAICSVIKGALENA